MVAFPHDDRSLDRLWLQLVPDHDNAATEDESALSIALAC